MEKIPLNKVEMVTHSSILAWEIPWTVEPGGLWFRGSKRVGRDWETEQLVWSKVKVAQLCATLWILQARILEWVAFPFSRGSSQPRDWTQVSCIAGRFFTSWATTEAQEYWNGYAIPSPGDLPNPGIEPGSPALQANSLPTEFWGKPQLVWLSLSLVGSDASTV